MPRTEQDPADAIVAALDPAPKPDDDGELTAILADLRAEIVRRRTGRAVPRRRLIGTAAVAGALLAGGAAAASGAIGLHTGWFGSPGATENDGSEWLRGDSPQMEAEIDALGSSIPLPPGGDWDYAKHSLADGGPQLFQEPGLRMTLSGQAACQWELYWLDARGRGEQARMRKAVRILEEVPVWPGMSGLDAAGLDWRREIAAGARAGDPGPVRQDIAANCDPAMWRDGGR